MKYLHKSVGLLLAGVLTASALFSCKSGNGEPTTTSATTAQPEEEAAPQAIVSPGDLYQLLLRTADYTIETELVQTYPDYKYIWESNLDKDGGLLLISTEERYDREISYRESYYCDLDQSAYYNREGGDWVRYEESESISFGELADYVNDLLPQDPQRLSDDASYEEYDPEARSYRMKAQVMEEVFAENDWDAPPEEYYLHYTESGERYVFTYYWKDQDITSRMNTVITMKEVDLTIPEVENAPIAEAPYEGEALDAALQGFRQVDLSERVYNFYTVGFEPWEDEEARRMFDGVKTYDEWYYNEDGTLKEGASPDAAEGGGPGKCAGTMANYCQFVFDFNETIEIAAYVLTNSNDNREFSHRTPVRWTLFGSNDENASDADTAFEANWITLDYVWDGGMGSENFASYGYLVDSENRGEYRYYCLQITYYSGNQIQIGELELYEK
ncbi:MAG: hypothetical protein IJX76_00035 [Clostridia bacterium]|nr:hypothetical protein [Clostridia bacterium]